MTSLPVMYRRLCNKIQTLTNQFSCQDSDMRNVLTINVHVIHVPKKFGKAAAFPVLPPATLSLISDQKHLHFQLLTLHNHLARACICHSVLAHVMASQCCSSTLKVWMQPLLRVGKGEKQIQKRLLFSCRSIDGVTNSCSNVTTNVQ